jgi:ferredoxin
MQVAVTAAGFTTLFFILIALAAALFMGVGRRSDSSRRAAPRGGRRDEGRGRSEPRGRDQPRGGNFKPGGKFGVSKHKNMLTVEVNPDKCARFGFCEHEAPDVFYLQSDGRFGYQAVVPVSRANDVIQAMDVCPRRAIKVKLPPEEARTRFQPDEPPMEARRAIVPLHGDRLPSPPQDGPRRPRRA